MGLDMYLAVDAEATKEMLHTLVDQAGLLQHWEYDGGPVKALGKDDEWPIVAYWRKANAIHGWIVATQANGVDECQRIRMPRRVLEDLVVRCKKVLTAHAAGGDQQMKMEAEAQGLLPTRGFFFGGYDLDEYYREDLQITIDQIEKVLAAPLPSGVEFFYRASW